MVYKCTKKLKKGGFFNTIRVGQLISQKSFDQLTPEEKTYFVIDNSDESLADQFEENQKADDAADKN